MKLLKNISLHLDDKTFSNEFETLVKLKHQNIIQLLGYCDEKEKCLVEYKGREVIADELHVALCLEYLEKGNLENYISDKDDGLEWHIRYKIIKGICEGLKYLHEGSENGTLLHLDLKPANILLDNEMMPKIADFGLSRFVCDKATRQTTSPIGTIGYWPPEYLERQMVSSAFDIFSLGVIITKIMIGTQGYNKFADLAHRKLVKQVRNIWKRRLQGIVSPRSLNVYCQQVKECISIASKCLNRDRHQRPDIQTIIQTLNRTETRIEKVVMTWRHFFLEKLFAMGVAFAMGLYIILLVSMGSNRPQLHSSTDTNQQCHVEWASSSSSSRFKQFDNSIHMLGKPARGYLQEFSRSVYTGDLIGHSYAPQKEYGEMPKPPSKVLKEIPYKLLKTITGDFSKLLGSGTLRTVFKGIDDNGQVTAVKIFKDYLGGQIVKQLQNEISITTEFEVEHENIIQPVGYCIENEEVAVQYNENEKRYIAYPATHAALCLEYMENGSLRDHISDASEGLNWCTRYKIIKGICDGLRYLHERLQSPVLHLNLKPSNILLDENMVPKISDFSLSTRLGEEDTRMIEPNVGTLTYMPPEFINRLVISKKFDIFSLGVIIIETVAGFSIYKLLQDMMPYEEIIELVLAKWTNRLQAMLTPQSVVERYCGQVRTCIQMALRCVDPDRRSRPSIGEVVAVLEAAELQDPGLRLP